MSRVVIFFLILLGLTSVIFLMRDKLMKYFFLPRDNQEQQATPQNSPTEEKDVEVITQNLNIPWEIAFLTSGDMLVTERSGKLLKVGKQTQTVKEIEGVRHVGEGGLLGLTLHPKFSSNNFIYLYLTYANGGQIKNRVERYVLKDNSLLDRKVILDEILGSSNHDGGRIAFGPDGYLYITTGDAENPDLAQDKNSLNGKILRIKDDGSIPSDNPFSNAVYSYGHRNPQGLAWDNKGNLWETEHGPSGSQTGNDEINLITKGQNYGWPIIKGSQVKEDMVTPVIESGRNDTWAPAGLVYLNGNLYFAGLRGEALYKAKVLSDNKLELSTHFKSEYGRLRAVQIGPDGFIYVTTSNRDGRGRVKSGDDKIIKVKPF